MKKKTVKKEVEMFCTPENAILKRRKEIADKNAIKRFIGKLLSIIIISFIIFRFIFGAQVVYNDDMFPKMVPSDLVLYYRLDRNFYVGDVVTIKKDGADYILRIIAGANDEVDISDNGQVVVNGSYQAESNIFYDTGEYQDSEVKFPLKLKEDEVFVLGDMRRGAKDSRYFGPVKKKEIKGKVFSMFRRANF